MPPQGRPQPVEGRDRAGDASPDERRLRDAMARQSQAQASRQQASHQSNEVHEQAEWNEAAWDGDHDEAGHRARRLLSRSSSGIHRVGDRLAGLQRWLAGERWVRRLAIVVAALAVIFGVSFFGLWWRLGAGPINLDMATPWLAAAIEDNIGHGNTVEVGGTQIERAGRIRIAVRIRDIVVRDRDHAVVATAPKAEVRLSGVALLMGRLRAESLNLVDAELSVRITPDGYVTVSTGDTTKPLATGVASKRAAGLAANPGQQTSPVAPSVLLPITPPPSAGSAPAPSGLLAGLDWLDSLSLTGLDGQNLNEIGLKNGVLDRRRSAARQQMEFREHQSQPAPAECRRRGARPRRGGRASLVGARHGRPI